LIECAALSLRVEGTIRTLEDEGDKFLGNNMDHLPIDTELYTAGPESLIMLL